MEDGFNNPGLPSSRDFVPTPSSGRAIAREPQVTSQRQSIPVPGPQRPEATLAADLQRPDPSLKARDNKATQEVTESVALANAIAAFLDTKVSFTYDDRIEQIVVKVTKGDDEEVIRQIPSEEMIKMVVQFRKDFRGLILNRTS